MQMYYWPDISELVNVLDISWISFQWCDNHEQCKRIKMSGFLIKPLQRVTKYSLLLRAISHKTEDEKEKALVENIVSYLFMF